MKPTFSVPNVLTTYGAAPPIGWPVLVSMTFETTHCERRLAHPLDQHVVAEVELVVAERGEIEAGGVQRGDHVLAFEHARRDRGRRGSRRRAPGTACVRPSRVLLQRRDAGEAAEAVDRQRGVDVVDLEKGDRRRARAAKSCCARRWAAEPREDDRGGSGRTRSSRRSRRTSNASPSPNAERDRTRSSVRDPCRHLRQIDVAAAEDDADARAANRRRAFERGRGAERAGRFDDQLQPLPQIEHRLSAASGRRPSPCR